MDADRGTWRRWVYRSLAALGIVALAAIIGLMVWEPFVARPAAPITGRAYKAEIIRDEWGVPHIYGKTDADAVFYYRVRAMDSCGTATYPSPWSGVAQVLALPKGMATPGTVMSCGRI